MNTQYLKLLPGGAFALLLMLHSLTAHSVSLEFFGLSPSHEGQYVGRVRIPIDDPTNNDPGPAVDVGATNFTIEFWMRTKEPGPSISCSSNNWIRGNILIDRDRYNQDRSYGIAITDGVVAFGVTAGSSETVCGSTNVADDDWHHVAVQRSFSDGRLFIYVDGELDAEEDGPDGDISYPDSGNPNNNCVINGMSNQACLESDPYIVIGAEKHDANVQEYPPYIGKIDELRFSSGLRYSTSGYTVPTNDFPDTGGGTVAMYHFEQGTAGSNCSTGTQILDYATGPENYGHCRFGGNSSGGPRWSADTPFSPLPPGSSSSSSSSGSGSSSSSSTSSSSGGSSTSSSSSSSSGGGDGGGGGAFHIGLLALLLTTIFRRRFRD